MWFEKVVHALTLKQGFFVLCALLALFISWASYYMYYSQWTLCFLKKIGVQKWTTVKEKVWIFEFNVRFGYLFVYLGISGLVWWQCWVFTAREVVSLCGTGCQSTAWGGWTGSKSLEPFTVIQWMFFFNVYLSSRIKVQLCILWSTVLEELI